MRFQTFALFFAVLIGAAFVAPSALQAAPVETPKIAYIDLTKILTESIRGRSTKTKIEQFFDERQKDLDAAQKALTDLERDYYETKPILNADAIQRKQEEIRRKRIELRRQLEDAERDLEAYEARVSRRMREDIFKIIADLGNEGNYTLIFNKTEGVLLYINPNLDISDEIIKRFDGMGDADS